MYIEEVGRFGRLAGKVSFMDSVLFAKTVEFFEVEERAFGQIVGVADGESISVEFIVDREVRALFVFRADEYELAFFTDGFPRGVVKRFCRALEDLGWGRGSVLPRHSVRKGYGR